MEQKNLIDFNDTVKAKVIEKIDQLVQTSKCRDFPTGKCVPRKQDTFQAHELYGDKSLGISERDCFIALNSLVRSGDLRIIAWCCGPAYQLVRGVE